MTQPIRPHDASGIYRRQVSHAEAAEAAEAGAARRANGGAVARRTDQVSVSDGAREFARIMDAVQQSPEVRADRVAAVRERIASGAYVVDATGLAALLADRGMAS